MLGSNNVQPAYPLGPRMRVIPGRGWRGGKPPSTPIREAGSIVSEGREVWVKIRASKAERAEWHAKARSVGSGLVFPCGSCPGSRRGGRE